MAGMVCLGFGIGLISLYGFFVDDLSREFGVGVATLNIAPVALLLVPGLVSPYVGKLVDRMPARRLILAGASVALLSLCLVSQAPNLLLAGLGFLGFTLGMTGYGPVVINALLTRVYPGREARALAIAAIGISLASIVLPPATGLLLDWFDWRTTLLSLSLSLLGIVWAVVLFAVPPVAGRPAAERQPLARAIYRERAFWLIGSLVALGFNGALVMTICYPPYFRSLGYSPASAGLLLALAGAGGLVGKTALAWLGDALRDRAAQLAAFVLSLQAVAIALLWSAESTAVMVVAMGLLGFGGGALIPLHPYLNSRYFDPAIIGQVNGAQTPLMLPLGLVGPPLAGFAYDRSGGYEPVLLAVALLYCLAAVLALYLSVRERELSPGAGPGG